MRIMLDSDANDETTFIIETSFAYWGNYIKDEILDDILDTRVDNRMDDLIDGYEGYLCFDNSGEDCEPIYVMNITLYDAEKAIEKLFDNGKLDLTKQGYMTLR